MRSRTSLTKLRRRSRQPPRAIAGQRRKHTTPARSGSQRRRVSARSSANTAGRREHRDGDEGEAPDPDQRRGLRQRQRPGQRIAVGVPGKSGEQMAAQPFDDGERDREREDAHRAARPYRAREREAEAGVTTPGRRAARSPRTAAASRRSWRRPGRRGRPNRAPRGNSRSRTTSRRRRARQSAEPSGAAPSISQTSTGKVRNSTGQRSIGGSASAETAPAPNAISGAPPAPGQHDRNGRGA